ncbi:MAG: signal peptidase I [Alphaproteobacteria bacterium]|nr:signal peptidase I [Alphaproteobacteria bacterium]
MFKKLFNKKKRVVLAAENKPGKFSGTLGVFAAIMLALVVRSFWFEPFHIPSGSMFPGLAVGDYLFISKSRYGYSNHSFPFSPRLINGRVFASAPERGDVIVFKKTKGRAENYIKRLVGMPGEVIQVRGGVLHINGEAVGREEAGRFWILSIPKRERGARRIDYMLEDGRRVSIERSRRVFIDGVQLAPSDFTLSFDNRGGAAIYAVRKYLETLPNGVSYFILKDRADADDYTEEFVVPAGHFFMMGDNRDDSTDSRFLDKVGFIAADELMGRAKFVMLSSRKSAAWWQVWSWPWAVRWERTGSGIR